jgi:hypothetical protein
MRHLARPIGLFIILGGFANYSLSQTEPLTQRAPDGAVNIIWWAKGSPAPTNGGVDVTIDVKPAANGWVCTDLIIRVTNPATGKTLGEYTVMNPGPAVSKSFSGFENNLKIRITTEALFHNNGLYDFKYIQAYVTTK